MKTEETSETMSCLQRFFFRHRTQKEFDTDKSKKFIKACQDLQWNHDTSTPSSLRNERSGRMSRPQSERENSYRTKCRVDDQKKVELCDGMPLLLARVHDKMGDGKTAFEKVYGQKLDGPSIPFG